MSNESESVELRSCLSTCVLLCFVPSLLVLFCLYLSLRAPGGFAGLLCSVAILGLVVYIAWSFRIRLSPSGIEYRGPFFSRWVLGWSTVRRVVSGARLLPGPRRPPYFMTLFTNNGTRPEIVNIKPFSRADLVRLVRYVQEHAPAAVLDDTTKAMGEGRVPTVMGTNRRGVV